MNWHHRLHESKALENPNDKGSGAFQDINSELNEQSMMRIRTNEDVYHDLDWNPFRTVGGALNLSLAETESNYFTLNKSLKG